jgi:hypothetical protein
MEIGMVNPVELFYPTGSGAQLKSMGFRTMNTDIRSRGMPLPALG